MNSKMLPMRVVRVQLIRPMHFQVLGRVMSSLTAAEDGVILFRTQHGISVRHDQDESCWETIPNGNIGLIKEAHAEIDRPTPAGISATKRVPVGRPTLRGLPDASPAKDVPAPGSIQSGPFRPSSGQNPPWESGSS